MQSRSMYHREKTKINDDPGMKRTALSSSSLVLIGTVHRDPRGFGKLLRVMEKEAPGFITVEISPYALEFRVKRAFHLRAILRENLKKILREEGGTYRQFISHGAIQG